MALSRRTLIGLTIAGTVALTGCSSTAGLPEGTVVIDFRVEQEDSVYPMVPTGADLKQMIRRPLPSPVNEAAKDDI